MFFEYFCCDFLFTVSGQAVQHHCVCFCNAHQFLVYLIAGESSFSCFLFFFLTHACPAVCDDNICALGSFHGFVCQCEFIGELGCKVHYHGIGVVTIGAGDLYVHACFQTTNDQGVCHVVAVANVAHGQTFQCAFVFTDGQEVSHYLTRVAQVCQTVDYGDGTVFCQHFHFGLFECTDHDTVQHTAHHAGGILCGFAAADLGIFCADEQSVTAQLVHACFKGDSCTCGGFFEDHAQSFAFQEMMLLAFFYVLFHGCCQIQQFIDFFCCAV